MLRQFIHLMQDLFNRALRVTGRTLIMTGMVMLFGGFALAFCIDIATPFLILPFDPVIATRYSVISALIGIPIAMLGVLTYNGAIATD